MTFDIDANGIVNVAAKDKATGKEQQIRIEASGGLSEGEIDDMVKEAESHAEEDKKRRALVETRNQADNAVHATEKTLAEFGDKVGAEDKAAVEAEYTRNRTRVIEVWNLCRVINENELRSDRFEE